MMQSTLLRAIPALFIALSWHLHATAAVLTTLDYRVLPEASGIAVSTVDEHRIWFINDSGNRAELVAYDLGNHSYTRVKVAQAENRDWEDLSAFQIRDEPWLAIADVGDNRARRRGVRVYFVPEPPPGMTNTSAHTVLSIRYPDGPRDVESLAVDAAARTVYLLSKRDPSPRLYRVALPELIEQAEYAVTAEFLGEVWSIPQPDEEEVAEHRYGKYRAQPTAMTLLRDGSAIAVMTYRGPYLATLGAEREWLKALNEHLCPVRGPELEQAETIGADRQGRLYLTSEGRGAPLVRVAARCAE